CSQDRDASANRDSLEADTDTEPGGTHRSSLEPRCNKALETLEGGSPDPLLAQRAMELVVEGLDRKQRVLQGQGQLALEDGKDEGPLSRAGFQSSCAEEAASTLLSRALSSGSLKRSSSVLEGSEETPELDADKLRAAGHAACTQDLQQKAAAEAAKSLVDPHRLKRLKSEEALKALTLAQQQYEAALMEEDTLPLEEQERLIAEQRAQREQEKIRLLQQQRVREQEETRLLEQQRLQKEQEETRLREQQLSLQIEEENARAREAAAETRKLERKRNYQIMMDEAARTQALAASLLAREEEGDDPLALTKAEEDKIHMMASESMAKASSDIITQCMARNCTPEQIQEKLVLYYHEVANELKKDCRASRTPQHFVQSPCTFKQDR
ncbi:unnamed protein product, partial [Symbiodinium microadriaticum]